MNFIQMNSCPCKHLEEPCNERCTCVNPFSSVGCRYCASYGSRDQQKAAAERIAKAIASYEEKSDV